MVVPEPGNVEANNPQTANTVMTEMRRARLILFVPSDIYWFV